MLFDQHIKKNSRSDFLVLFEKLLKHEIEVRNQPSLGVVIDTLITPELAKLRARDRRKSQEQKREQPDLQKHKKITKKKK